MDACRAALAEPRISSAYTRTKCADFGDFAAFLTTCPWDRAYGCAWPLTPASCQGLHVVDYCVSRILRPTARTVVHSDACPRALGGCACPRTLAASSVDSLLGRLRAGFNAIGRSNKLGGPGANPCAAPCVTDFLRDVIAQQAKAGITPHRARPMLSDKLAAVFSDMERVIADPGTPPSHVFATLRSRAIFALGLRSLKRGEELMRTRTSSILAFPDGSGLIFNYTWGKTLRDGSSHSFGVVRDTVCPESCAVAHLIAYVQGALSLGVDLSLPGPGAPLFRPWLGSPEATTASVLPLPVRSLNVSIKAWLTRLGIFAGETYQGFRSGGAIEMALRGEPLFAIMAQGYWATARMASHYMGFDRSIVGGGPGPANPGSTPGGALSPPPAVIAAWRAANELHGFFQAFPEPAAR